MGYLPAVNLSTLYRQQGHHREADAILTECEKFLDETDLNAGRTYLKASIAAIKGNQDEASAYLARAYGQAWYRRWYLSLDPNMASALNDPRIQKIMWDIESKVADMRRNLELDPGLAALAPPDRRL